jgi:hypothetical protein
MSNLGSVKKNYKRGCSMSIPTKNDFINAIQELKIQSRTKGFRYIEILSSDLHRKLGHYPGPNHRMPSCCEAMYDLMEEHKGDLIVTKPPNGRGANLKIRYYL